MPDLASARAHNQSRLNRIAAVENGALESNDELLSGFPYSYGSAERSCQQWIATTIDDLENRSGFFDDTKLIAALKALHVRFDIVRLERVVKIAEASNLPEIAQRALIYLCHTSGQHSVLMRVAAMCMSKIKPESMSAPFYLATAIGLVSSARANSMAAARTAGFKSFATIRIAEHLLREASKEPERSPADLSDDEHDEFMQAVLDDRAEFFGNGTDASPLRIRSKPPRPGAVVVPKFEGPPPTGPHDRQRLRKPFEGIAGRRLPFVLTGDVHQHMLALQDRAPHLRDLFHEMLLDTCMSQHLDLRPWLLVGPPGSGKSWAARQFAEVTGSPVSIYDAGSSHDASFGGTPAQWHSAGPAEPLRLVAHAGVANPLLVLDEIDKAASSPHNGSIHSSLLTFLDPGSAATFRDPALEMAVNLSHVNYILTANDLSSVPAPLRDRCRVVRVPNPGPEHVGVLVRRIVEDVARKKGIDPRWTPPLAPDELDNIGAAWGGGSIRKLRDATLAALEFRDQSMGRC